MNPRSDHELMNVHVSTLFACDADGRLRSVREPGNPHAPPRFFMGRTLQSNVWHFRHDLPQELTDDLERLCRVEPVETDLSNPPRGESAIRAALEVHAPITHEERGPAYVIPEGVRAPRGIVWITKENGHLLKASFPWLRDRILNEVDVGPVAASVVGGSVVSTCYCARLSPSAAEAGVVTIEAMRGRGHATAVVAGWASAVREKGLLPLYSTSWENLPSQRVAGKIGMVLYGVDWWID